MSRVQVDLAAGWLAREAALPGLQVVGSDSSGLGLFEQHLEQAQKLAGTPSDARPAPPPGAALPDPSESSVREYPGQSASDDSAAPDNPADLPSSRAEAERSEEAGSGHEEQQSPSGRHDDEEDPDRASDAAPAAGAAATAAQTAQTQTDKDPPHGRGEKSAASVESSRAGSRLAATQTAMKNQAGTEDSTAEAASARPQPSEAVDASHAATDRVANAGGEIVEEESGDVAEGQAQSKSGQLQPAAVPADRLPASSPEVAGSSSANGRTEDIQAESRVASVQTDVPVSASPLEPAVEGQATQAMVRRTGPRPGARVSSEPQSAQPAPQAATADENVPLEATVRPDDSGTVPADPSSANDKVKAAGHDPSNPPGDAKVADLSASHNASAQASDGAGRRSDDAATTDAADRARFVQRVARAFESAVDHAGQVRLRLHPPELGSLRLDLTIRNGQMSARLETETEAARNMLMENLPELKERLAGHHIQVERFDIEWRGQAQGGLPQRSGDHDRWQPPPSRAGRVPGVAGGGSGPDAAAGAGRRLNPGTSFDVVI